MIWHVRLIFSVYREDCTNEWFLVYGDDYKVQDIIVDSKAGRILSGVSFWDAPTAEKIVSFIDKAYASGEFVDLYWDNMVKDNIKELDVYVEELEGNSIYEIDSVQDYHKLEEILKNEKDGNFWKLLLQMRIVYLKVTFHKNSWISATWYFCNITQQKFLIDIFTVF